MAKKIADQNALTACVLEQVVEREVDIRQRHARLARSLQQAAIERLMAIKPSELSRKLAIEMLRLGITVEREALGLGDVAPKLFDDAEDTLHVREAVQDAQEILARHAPSLRRESVPEYEKVAHNAARQPCRRWIRTFPTAVNCSDF